MSFLLGRQFRLLAAQAAFGLGDFHTLAGSRTDEVGFELRDHCQDVEQKFAHRVGRIVD
jgi:hypothetical protein